MITQTGFTGSQTSFTTYTPDRRTFADLCDIEPRLLDIAADALVSRWSVARYELLKRRAARYVGWHARDHRLASSRCYEVAIWHIAGLMRRRQWRGRR